MLRGAGPKRGAIGLALSAVLVVATGCSPDSGTAVGDRVVDDHSATSAGQEEADTRSAPGALDAPVRVSGRWWRSPSVQDIDAVDQPRLAAAAAVLERYFGSDDARDMTAVSVDAAHDLARFMVQMQQLTSAHPMEPVTTWQTFEVVSDDAQGLKVRGHLSEDRATGSGQVERKIFDDFTFVEDSDGHLLLSGFERNDVPIADETLSSDALPPAVDINGAQVSIEAGHRSSIGMVQIAGQISGPPGTSPAELLDGEVLLFDPAPAQPRFVDSRVADDGVRYFLLSFPEVTRTSDGATLELALGPDRRQVGLAFELPPW